MSYATPIGLGLVLAGLAGGLIFLGSPLSARVVIAGFGLLLAGIGWELHGFNRRGRR